jgi:hypothetical protein
MPFNPTTGVYVLPSGANPPFPGQQVSTNTLTALLTDIAAALSQGGAGPIIKTTFANLPTPAVGMFACITDGKAANCADGTCTTWGTNVTGGGGALNLLIWYNNTHWTLVGK